MEKDLNDLCQDVFSTLFPKQRTYNKDYESIKRRIRKCPKEWCKYGQAVVIPQSLYDDFDCCPDFIEGGQSYKRLDDGREFVRYSVLPLGNKRRTYYKFIVIDDED